MSGIIRKNLKKKLAALSVSAVIGGAALMGAAGCGTETKNYTDANVDSTKIEQVENEDTLQDNSYYEEKIAELEQKIEELQATNKNSENKNSDAIAKLQSEVNMLKLKQAFNDTFSTQYTEVTSTSSIVAGTSSTGSLMYSGGTSMKCYTTIAGDYATETSDTGVISYLYHDSEENITFGKGSALDLGQAGSENSYYVKKDDSEDFVSLLSSGFCVEGYTVTEDDGVYTVVTNDGTDFGTVTTKNGLITGLTQFSHSDDYTDAKVVIKKITKNEAKQNIEKIQNNCEAYQGYKTLEQAVDGLKDEAYGELTCYGTGADESTKTQFLCGIDNYIMAEGGEGLDIYSASVEKLVWSSARDGDTMTNYNIYDNQVEEYTISDDSPSSYYQNFGGFASDIVDAYSTSSTSMAINLVENADGTTTIELSDIENENLKSDYPITTTVQIDKDGNMIEMDVSSGETSVTMEINAMSESQYNEKYGEAAKNFYGFIDIKKEVLKQ